MIIHWPIFIMFKVLSSSIQLQLAYHIQLVTWHMWNFLGHLLYLLFSLEIIVCEYAIIIIFLILLLINASKDYWCQVVGFFLQWETLNYTFVKLNLNNASYTVFAEFMKKKYRIIWEWDVLIPFTRLFLCSFIESL